MEFDEFVDGHVVEWDSFEFVEGHVVEWDGFSAAMPFPVALVPASFFFAPCTWGVGSSCLVFGVVVLDKSCEVVILDLNSSCEIVVVVWGVLVDLDLNSSGGSVAQPKKPQDPWPG